MTLLLPARTPINYVSLFSGIGGFDIGFDRAGMRCKMQVEFNEHASGVLAHHWPTVDRLKDVRDVRKDTFRAVDLICGGFPCQDVSVAGRRAGLAGERSGLWFEFLRIITEHTPRWVVIENVPGLLSSNRGRDFAVIIDGLVKCGYCVAWRVLDAQYFGVPQRRRRVFIVASLGNGRCAEVLFEREGRYGDSPPSRETGESITGTLAAGAHASGFNGRDAERGMLVPFSNRRKETGGIAETIRAGSHGALPMLAEAVDVRNSRTNGSISGTLQSKKSGGYSLNYINPVLVPQTVDTTGHQGDRVISPDGVWPTLSAESANNGGGANASAFAPIAFSAANLKRNAGAEPSEHTAPKVGADMGDRHPMVAIQGINMQGGKGRATSVNDVAPTLGADDNMHSITAGYGVRRLTPTECERLQGFPDGHTAVNGQSDSARYKQLGNAVCVNVAEWLGRRIAAVDVA